MNKELFDSIDNLDLTIQQKKFVYYYCENGFNAKEAIISSGSKCTKGINQLANKYLRKSAIQKAIKQYLNSILEQSKISLEKKLFDILYKRAFFDINDFVDDSGEFLPISNIKEEDRVVIDGTEVKYYGKDAKKKTVVSKLADRDKAIDKLSKYIEMIKETSKTIVEMSAETEELLKKVFEGKATLDV